MATTRALQDDAQLEQLGDGVERLWRRLEDRDRHGQRVHERRVAETARALFQIRLEHERHDPRTLVARRDVRDDEREPALHVLGPLVHRPAGQVVGEGPVAGDEAQVEETQRGLEITVGDREGLLHRPDAVVEPDPRVPDRVPDLLGDLLDVAAARMDEQDVEIARGRQLAPPVATHADDRVAVGIRRERGQPLVEQRGVGVTERESPQ